MRVGTQANIKIPKLFYLPWSFSLGFTLLFFSVVSSLVFAEEGSPLASTTPQQAITLAAEDSWPPFANQFGQGISHRLITAAFKQSNIEVNSLVVPYSRALMMAEKGAVDGVFNVAREASTEQRFVFGTTPLFIATASFYHKKEQAIKAANKWDLPKGTVVGVVKSYEYGDEFPLLVKQRQLNLVQVATQQQLINLLLIGRIDTALMFDLVAKDNLQKMGVSDEVIPAFNNHSSNIYLAFSKANPKSVLLAQALDKGLLQLKNDGQYQQLFATEH